VRGGFGVSGYSRPNFLAFNSTAILADGGIPTRPEFIRFRSPVSHVEIKAGSSALGEVEMSAYDPSGVLVDSATVTLTSVLQKVEVNAEQIVLVRLWSGAYTGVVDDLLAS
jgi:hypothetical protein